MAQQQFKLVIIGAGNVATHIAKRLKKKGFYILQLVSKGEKNAEELGIALHVPFVTNLKKINKHADIYLFCIPDDEIERVSKNLKLSDKLVIHTSGSVNMDALKPISSNMGVLYPVQSFSRHVKTSFTNLPILIEANSKKNLQTLKTLAIALSKNVHEVNSAERLKLHLAATMVNNFSNYLYTLSYDFLAKEKSKLFKLLLPLLKETTKKMRKQEPFAIQTGPAKRGDTKTINKHIKLLEKYPEQKKVYELFSELIKNYYA